MRFGPKYLSSNLHRYIAIDAPPQDCISILSRIIVAEGKAENQIDAQLLAEKWKPKFLSMLSGEISAARELGKYLPVDVNSISPNMIQGGAFIESNDNELVRNEKNRRLKYANYMDSLSEIGDDQFEWLSAGIVNLLGAARYGVTKRSGDEGFDCWGEVDYEENFLSIHRYHKSTNRIKFWLLGQSKNYSKVHFKTSEFRELIGSYKLAELKIFGSTPLDKIPFSFRPLEPVLIIILTTGVISANAWRMIEKAGVLALDCEMIAEFLMQKEIGLDDGEFNSAKFKTWVCSFSS